MGYQKSFTWYFLILVTYTTVWTETFLIIINVENSCAALYFGGNFDQLDFSGFFDE